MAKTKFERLSYSSVYQQIDKISFTLIPGAAAVPIATFDITPIEKLTVTVEVTVAALTGLEVWVKGDKYGKWFPIPINLLLGYGRTDAGTDITTTPSGVACVFMLDCSPWSDVEIRAKSAGAAKLTVTAGGK